MADKQTLAVDLAIIAGAREPNFSAQTAIDVGGEPGAPSSPTAGVDVTTAIMALIALSLRADASTHRVIVQVTAVDDTATYTVTLGGTPFAYAASPADTEDQILAGLQALVDANPSYNASVSGTGAAGQLIITGAAEASYTSVVSATGTGSLSKVADATTVDFRVWGLPKNQADDATTWYRLPVEGPAGLGAAIDITTTRNWCDEFRIPGYSRLFIEIVSTDGSVLPSVGPAVFEAL